MSNSPTRIAALAGAAVALVAIAAGPAAADDRMIHDRRGDAPAKIDLTRIRLANQNGFYTAEMHVRHLRWAGTFSFDVALDNADDQYLAGRVTARRDLTLRKRVFVYDRAGTHPVDCSLRVRFRPATDVVRIRMPHTCADTSTHNPFVMLQSAGVKDGEFFWDSAGGVSVGRD